MPSISAEFSVQSFAATYYDGRTAQRHSATVRLEATALDVEVDGHVVDQWAYDAVTLSDQGGAGARVVKRGTEARLVIADAAAFAQLRAHAPGLESQRKRTLRNIALAVGVTAAVVLGGYVALPPITSAIVSMISLEREARIGDAYTEQVAALFAPKSNGALCDGRAGREALDAVVAHLSAHTSGPFPYRVDVLDTPLVNAVALPGGHILLFRGVLEAADSASEVAGILAHEMQHVNLRHGMQAVVRSYGISLLADMMFGGGVMGDISSVLMTTSYSRDAETAADEGAIAALHDARIGTAGMARFFARLKAQEDDSVFALPQLLSTHPPSAAREALALGSDPSQAWSISAAQWTALKAICQ